MSEKYISEHAKKEVLKKLHETIDAVKKDQASSVSIITGTVDGNLQLGQVGNGLELIGAGELAKETALSRIQKNSDAKQLLQHLFEGMTSDDDD